MGKRFQLSTFYHLENFLLELGQGFAFVGGQVHMEVGDEDFYIDLFITSNCAAIW